MTLEGRGVRSIEVGARLLDALVTTGAPMMLRDIAKAAGVAAAQAHAYLVSYRKHELVEQDEATGLYRVGAMALQLGIARLRSFDAVQAASEEASWLAAESGLTVLVAVWGAYGPTIIQVHEGAGQVLINTRPGTVYSMTGTATGQVFTAFLRSDLVAQSIRAQRPEGAKSLLVGQTFDLKRIQPDIDLVRERGYAIAESNPIPNVNAISAPVFDVAGQLSMAVTLIGESGSIAVSDGSAHVRSIVQLAHKISTRSGFFEFAPTLANAPAGPGRRKRARGADGVQ